MKRQQEATQMEAKRQKLSTSQKIDDSPDEIKVEDFPDEVILNEIKHQKISIISVQQTKPQLDDIFGRFPALGVAIFSQLPDQNLVECYQVSKTWDNFVKNQKLPWIRMIKKQINHISEHPETWSRVVRKTAVEIVREVAISLQKFATSFLITNSKFQLTPLHVVAGYGTLNIYKF